MEEILNKYDIRPMVGIIPQNEDPQQLIDPIDSSFWEKVSEWQNKGWTMAVHGYNHVYKTFIGGGINPMWKRSEFNGVPLEEQKDMIRNGVAIMRRNGINPNYFFAPSHTFDENTLIALREESDIRIISDTIGRYPYKDGDFWYLPQIAGHCVDMPVKGVYTFCFHPNTMTDTGFENMKAFLAQNHSRFISFDQIDLSSYGRKKLFDRFISWLFFIYRKIRGLR